MDFSNLSTEITTHGETNVTFKVEGREGIFVLLMN